ncbi:MAG TPA: TIGR03936 family radical SAM-associated protein [Candidatus Limnocylindrales bacterium]
MSESIQRWRLVFARDEEARFLSHLDAVKLWERAFRRGSIPVATSEGFSPRPRVVFAAPLPLGMLAEHELADLFLAERLTSHDLRARLAAGMPRGYRVVDLHDEWVGAPALAPQLVAADYRLILLGVESEAAEEGIRTLLAAERLPRERRREDKVVRYDLRPLLTDLRVHDLHDLGDVPLGMPEVRAGAALTAGAQVCATASAVPAAEPSQPAVARGVEMWMRLRHSQDEGSGRAEEVVAALADALSASTFAGSVEQSPIELVHPVRERLWLTGELAT